MSEIIISDIITNISVSLSNELSIRYLKTFWWKLKLKIFIWKSPIIDFETLRRKNYLLEFFFFPPSLELLCKQMGLNFWTGHTPNQFPWSKRFSRLSRLGDIIVSICIANPFKKDNMCIPIERKGTQLETRVVSLLCDSTEMLYLMRIFRSCLFHHFVRKPPATFLFPTLV